MRRSAIRMLVRLAGAYAAWFVLDLARLWVEFVACASHPESNEYNPATGG